MLTTLLLRELFSYLGSNINQLNDKQLLSVQEHVKKLNPSKDNFLQCMENELVRESYIQYYK